MSSIGRLKTQVEFEREYRMHVVLMVSDECGSVLRRLFSETPVCSAGVSGYTCRRKLAKQSWLIKRGVDLDCTL